MRFLHIILIISLLQMSTKGFSQNVAVNAQMDNNLTAVPVADVSFEDELTGRFEYQLAVFPQEKLYLHTDKPYYISGEWVWFRAYLADAETHYPVSDSRYVYVELINPLDSVVTRVKIRQDDGGAFHGYMLIPDNVPEGDYTLRAYTTFMRSQDEHYFFTNTIRIGDPQGRDIHTESTFRFEPDRRVHAAFRFSQVNSSAPLVPKSVKASVNGGRMMNIDIDDDGTARFNFNLPSASGKRTILLEVVAFNYPYCQFISVPAPDDDFDVTFYPEGGSLMEGTLCKVAFKAMKSNGQATHISGVIYDRNGTEIREIHSDYSGMGSFVYQAEKGNTYYVVCENDKGQTKRFNLPAALDRGYALTVNPVMDRIRISLLQPAETSQNDELYLLAHTRGFVHFVEPWNHANNLLIIEKEALPSGVLHLILFDANCHPLSERLVFINNRDQAVVNYQPDQAQFVARSQVNNRVTLTDSDGEPLTGNFSVSVTSDREVTADSTSNILTRMLLSSDVHGYIENPAYYFQNTPESTFALDLLMCTQGWRR